MRYLGIVAVAALLVMAAARAAPAGDYHHGTQLLCPDCHTMHYSQTESYNPDSVGTFTPLGPGGPFLHLLRNTVNNLCLSCHNGQSFAPDVLEANNNSGVVPVRQAGALNRTNASPYFEHTGHTLDSPDTPPGGSWTPGPDGLECTNCHSAHGGGLGTARGWADPQGSYRNLGGFGTAPGSGVGISYTRIDVDGVDLTKDVAEDVSSGVAATHYGVTGIAFQEPDATKSYYANFCKGCHTDFHGDVGGTEIGGTGTPAEGFIRHPTNGVDIGAHGPGGHSQITTLASRTNQVQVLSPAGKKAGTYLATDTDLTPSCMSCHKGHGNQNAFGLIFMSGTGTVTEQGDDPLLAGTSGVRALCKQCHVQGG